MSPIRNNPAVASRPAPGKVEDVSPTFDRPEYFLNRELSWLEFNQRVLEEAQDPSQPLLERLRFLTIVSSNLDEFFEVRVSGIKQQIENGTEEDTVDGMPPDEVFRAIEARTRQLVADQYQLWNGEIHPALEAAGIHLLDIAELAPADLAWVKAYFHNEVLPVLTPLAVDSSHPFPQLLNKSHNLIIQLRRPQDSGREARAIVQIPRVLPRLVPLPAAEGKGGPRFVQLSRLIAHFVSELFPGDEVAAAYAFRVTRNSDLYIDEEEAENLLRSIEEELRKRNRGNAVRLEVEADCPPEVEKFLLDVFRLGPEDLYRLPGPLNFLHFAHWHGLEGFAELRDRPWTPILSADVPPETDIFALLREKDLLLHHPYESFGTVVDFLEAAANCPQVLAIKMTLYRTGSNSPIIRALVRAAENGKQVTVLMEIKARFDEENNIVWARRLEEAGVHVVYGVVGLKTHCKVLHVVRRDEDRIRFYTHLGTGNYNPATARFYTDLSLFTTRLELTQEVATLFNVLTGLRRFDDISHLLVAPFSLLDGMRNLIQAETASARAGKGGRIIAKMNSLVDEELIRALYEASCAGVKVDLIVRGVCCLRPGIPGVSENIRVVSIIGRFLEHSRIFSFGQGEKAKIYLGSADWMPRNLHRRVEVVFPVLDPKLRDRIRDEILPVYLRDCVKARQLEPSGAYRRLHPEGDQQAFQAQLAFRELARRQQGERRHKRKEEAMLTPVTAAGEPPARTHASPDGA
jgi:polyphosphate kinase